MPSTAVPSVKDGVTVSPPCTASDSVTVKVMDSPSDALASFTVTAALSSSSMVPMPVSLEVTPLGALETVKLTVNVSSASSTASSVVVETVNVLRLALRAGEGQRGRVLLVVRALVRGHVRVTTA